MKKTFTILLLLLFFCFIGNWNGTAQAQPQIYHKIIAWKGTPVKIIKTFDDNLVLLWTKDTTVSYDTFHPGRQIIYLTKVNTKDTSIMWNNRVILEDYKRGTIGYNLIETKNQNIMIFGGYYDSTSISKFGAIKYNSKGGLLSFTIKPIQDDIFFNYGILNFVNTKNDEILLTTKQSLQTLKGYLIYYKETNSFVKLIDSVLINQYTDFNHFLLPYSMNDKMVSYVKKINNEVIFNDVDENLNIFPIKKISISLLNSYNFQLFSNPLNNNNLILTKDSLYLTNADFSIIKSFPDSNYIEKGFQSQTITDIKYLSDGSIMFGGIITAVLDYGSYLTKINCHGEKVFWQPWENEAPYYNAGFVEDVDGGIISFVARGNDGSAYPNLMWIEKRNSNGLLENWTPTETPKHSIEIKTIPNPAHDYTVIDLSESFTGDVIMFNLLGQVMLQKSVTEECDIYLNTQGFEKGMYFIKLNGDKQFTNAAKLIIQ